MTASPSPEYRRFALVVLVLALALFAWNVWAYDLWAPDEPFFGEGAREMIADGQWLVPHVNGVANAHKPPLFFWLIAVISLPFGHVSSLAARLPSVVASLGSVALTMRLGRRLAGGGRLGERTGLLAGLVLATSYLPWDKARSAQIDALLCFLVLGAIAAFEAFRAGDAEGRRAGVLFWVLGALATVAKGPVGILIPLGVALVTLAWDRNLAAWRRFAPWLGPLAFVVVAGAWAVPASIWGGDYTVWSALKTHFINRALHGMHHTARVTKYLEVLPYQLLPWTGFLFGAGVWAWRRRSAADRLLVAWVLFVIGMFTLSNERRDLYDLPAFPALAVLVAQFLAARVTAGEGESADAKLPGPRWVHVPLVVTGVLFAVLGAVAPRFATGEAAALRTPALALAGVFILGGVAVAVLGGMRRTRAGIGALAATIAVALLFAATAMPLADPFKSARPFAESMALRTAEYRASGGTIAAVTLGNVPNAIAFYSGIYTKELDDPQKLDAFFAEGGERMALVDRKTLRPGQLPEGTDVVIGPVDLSRMDVMLVRHR